MADDPGAETLRCASVRLRHRPLLRFIASSGFVVAGFSLLLTPVFGVGALVIALLFLPIPVMLAFSERRYAGGEVVLEPSGIRLHTPWLDRAIARAEVEGGYVATQPRATVLRLSNGQEAIIELGDPEAPERVLDHLVDLHKQVVTAPLRGVFGAFTRGLITFTTTWTVCAPASSRSIRSPARACWETGTVASSTMVSWSSARPQSPSTCRRSGNPPIR